MPDRSEFFVRLSFCGTQQDLRQKQQDITLIYVLEGWVTFEVGGEEYTLQKGDVLLINDGDTGVWKGCGDPFLCVIDIDSDTLLEGIGQGEIKLSCNSAADPGADYKLLREIIRHLILEYSADPDSLSFRKMSLFYRLLDVLIPKYVIESKTPMELAAEDDEFGRILKYIGEHYRSQLSQSDVAGAAYMSTSTFSRYFKKHAGINFLEYLNNLRLRSARQDLLYSDKPLTDIALDNGFTNPSMFSRAFRAGFGMSPSDYKKRAKEGSARGEDSRENPRKDFSGHLKRFVAESSGLWEEPALIKTIFADAGEFRPYRKVWNLAVNVGSALELRSAKMQQHVLELKRELHFRYMRITSIFTGDIRIRREGQPDVFNFEDIDEALDFLTASEILPIIEFGDKPRRIVREVDDLLYLDEERPLIRTVEEWRALLDAFMRHITSRYGETAVGQWIFELWFDPRMEYAEAYSYPDLFAAAAESVHTRAPGAKIGGAGLELGNMDFSFLEIWSCQDVQPDFLSVCAFPYKRTMPGLGVQKQGAERSTDFYFLQNETHKLKEQMKQIGWDGLPLVFSEWDLSMSDRNAYNDSSGKAAQMLMNMVSLQDEIDMGIYLFGSDLNVRYYDTANEFFGGSGLLSKDGLPKPAFYALQFLQRQGDYLIRSGDGYLLTSDGKDTWHALLFNYKEFNSSYFAQGEEQITAQDLPYLFFDREPVEFDLTLSGVPEGTYELRSYRVGIGQGSALYNWMRFGKRSALDANELDYLKRISFPRTEVRTESTEGETLRFCETLDAGEIRCLHIRIYTES